MLPKISIVTPSYNQAEFLEATIKSILDQDYPNLEYVVIDGGSTDGSVEIIQKYAEQLHYWVSEKDQGHGHALNKGFAKSTGEIMAWLNSDDMYTPWCLRTVAEIFTAFPHVEWIVGFNSHWNTTGVMTTAWRAPKNVYDFLSGNYAWIEQESVFWRRSLWEKSGAFIDQNQKLMVDGELWTRFFLHAELYSVDCILGGYRIHGRNRAGLNEPECCEEMEQAISKMQLECPRDVLETFEKLRRLGKFTGKYRLSRFVASRLFNEGMFSGLADKLAYKNIHFEDDRWSERTLPFDFAGALKHLGQ